MAHDEKVRALIHRVTERPLLVDPASDQTVLANLRALGEHDDFAKWMGSIDHNQSDEEFFADYGRPYHVVDGILQVPVMGMLLNRFSRQLGTFATGYQYIERAYARGMDDPNVRGIALVVDSTGGEAAGNFELVDKMRARRGEKPVRAFVADRALSGGYSIASVAREVVITRSGSAGSIGVVTMHVSMAERLEQMGVEVTFIFAGKHKVDGNRFEKLSKDARANIQARIDKTYSVFVETVARNRNMSQDAVRETEALVYDSDDAIEVGLADRIGALEDEMIAFSADLDREDGDELMTQDAKKPTEQNAETVSKADHEAAVASARQEAVAAERKRAADVTGSEHYAGREKLAQSLLNTDLSAEQIVAALENAPKAEAPKAAAKDDEKPETKKAEAGGGDQFKKFMDKDGHPEVGDEGGKDADEGDDTAKAVAGIMGAYSQMTGETFGDKKKAH